MANQMFSSNPQCQAAASKAAEAGVDAGLISSLIGLITSGKGKVVLTLIQELIGVFTSDKPAPSA